MQVLGFSVYLAWLFYKISEAYLNQDLARHQEGLQKAQPEARYGTTKFKPAEPGNPHDFQTSSTTVASTYRPDPADPTDRDVTGSVGRSPHNNPPGHMWRWW